MPELARETGFSRFHLARLFKEVTHESLEGFIRRIRLERSAFMILHSTESIEQIATECGYFSSESFTRAFKGMYGVPPSRLKEERKEWKLFSPTNLHWNEHWGSHDPDALPGKVEMFSQPRPAMRVAVWRWVGNYSRLYEGWQQLENLVGEVPRKKKFITCYCDNMWTHPTQTTMRADIGWFIEGNENIPSEMRAITLPKGSYQVSTRYIKRTERNDAWSYVSIKSDAAEYSLDEYPSWPLPFEKVMTRIVYGPVHR